MNAAVPIGIRVGVVVVGLALWFWSQRLIGRKAAVASGVGDRLHAWSAPLHGWFRGHARATDATLIVSSALIDVFGLYLLGSAIFGSSLRPLLAVLILFSLRQICQLVGTLPPPSGMLWRDPGFPSLLVTYGTSNDFFFSGHTAIAVLGVMELAQVAPSGLVAAAAGIAVLEAVTVIVLRAHYTMDVFGAIFTAWGAETIAQRLAPTVDAWLKLAT